MNSDSYLYFNIAQEIRLYINSTMKHQLKFYIVLFFIQLFPCAFAQQMSVSTLPLNNFCLQVLFCGFIVTGKAFCG